MKTFELEKFGVTPMEENELQINGGSNNLKLEFWPSLGYLGAAIAEGVFVFGTQAGRNAGLCVK